MGCDCGACCNACGHDVDCTSRLGAAADRDGYDDYLLARAS